MNVINHIIHLSDIHIGKHDHKNYPYSEIFQNLVINLPPSNGTLIVICGDIFDNKNRYGYDGILALLNLQYFVVLLL